MSHVGPPYEAMVLSCIDPRMQEPVWKHLHSRDLTGWYSQFTIAGAAIGVVAPKFEGWHRAFWENLEASIALHQISKIIVVNHRDCGAAKLAYEDVDWGDRDEETRKHREALAEFRSELSRRFPKLGIEAILMDINGEYEAI